MFGDWLNSLSWPCFWLAGLNR